LVSTIIKDGVEWVLRELRKAGVSYEDARVLVTGGAGFLGSWLCDVLIQQDAKVTCLDNFSSGHPLNIEHLRNHDNFTFIEHDISQPINFNKKFDVVMHLASRASPFEFSKFPIQILKANTLGIWVALGIAKKHKATLLYTSSSEIYGNPPPKYIPTPEIYNGNVNPVGPRSCYDEAKRCGEAFVVAYHLQHGLDTRIIRIFNSYGPRMRAGDVYGRVIPRFIDQALANTPITVFGDGTQTRAFTYVTDMTNGLLCAGLMPAARGQVINIGNNVETQIIQLAQLIKKLAKSNSSIKFYPLPIADPERRCPDITRAQQLIRWQPTTCLEDGLKATIKWFKQIA